MGSFNHYKRKVENNNLSIWRRLSALRSCILRLAWKKNLNFQSVLKYYDDKYHFDRYRNTNVEPPTEELLLTVLEEVVKEREFLLGRG